MTEAKFVPSDPRLPALRALFSESGPPAYIIEAAARLSGQRPEGPAERTYTRYWPGRRCVVQWTWPAVASRPPLIVSAELLSEKEAAKGRAGQGEYLAGDRTWVQVFPHDNVLPAIATAVSREWIETKLAPALGVDAASVTARAVSYKSWRRCVVEYTAGNRRYYGKLFRDDRGAVLSDVLGQFEDALASAGNSWTIPETVLYDPETRMLVQAELPGGRSLSSLLTKAVDDAAARAELLSAVGAAAEGLGALQSIPPFAGLETFTVHDAMAALRDDVDDVSQVAPDAGVKLRGLIDAMGVSAANIGPEPLVLAHSAFRHSHVYAMPGGLALLDLDNLRLSSPNADPGYFLAYIDYSRIRRQSVREVLHQCGEAFLEVWQAQPAYNADSLMFFRRYVLLKWVIRSFFSLDPAWRQTLNRAIERSGTFADASARRTRQFVSDPLLEVAGVRNGSRGLILGQLTPALFPEANSVDVGSTDFAYDPGEQVVVLAKLEVTEAGGTRQEQVVLTFKQPDDFGEMVRQATSSGGPGIYVSPAGDYVAEVFPRDYQLPGLARSLDHANILRMLTGAGAIDDPGDVGSVTHEILRYRPHERCVVRYTLRMTSGEVRRYVAKVYNDEQTTSEVWTTLRSLRSQLTDPVLVVEPVAVDEQSCIVIMENIEGDRVGDLLDETSDADEARRYVDMTADGLARLHGLTLEQERVKTFETEIEKLRVHERSTGAVSDNLGAALHNALNSIEARGRKMAAIAPTFVHGGFKPTQMLLRPNGKVTVVDFDGSCVGDPAIDVGRFMAKIRVDGLTNEGRHLAGLDQYFLDVYTARSGLDLRGRARIFQAMALVRMASRRFETGITSFHEGELADQPSGVLLREAMACLELG